MTLHLPLSNATAKALEDGEKLLKNVNAFLA
jgi:hypothetical protein